MKMSWLGYVASSLASLLSVSQVPFAFSGKATTALPYLNTLCVCVLWLAYAIDHKNLFIYVPNALGILAGMISIIGSKKFEMWFNIPLATVFLLFFISDQIRLIYRFILIVAGIVLFISPIYDIIQCCMSHVTIKTSWLFLWVSVVNTIVWIIYGVVQGLWAVWVSNGLGLVFILIQMIVIVVYNSSIKREELLLNV
tara:strand:- start:1786 stop:2376 length:591 start_codon:yes stop_codon:yes gene_type:complete